MTKEEPVAFINVEQRKLEWAKPIVWGTPTVVNLPKIPLYTHSKEWVGLTTDQMMAIAEWQLSAHRPLIDVIKTVEQALKDKNTWMK